MVMKTQVAQTVKLVPIASIKAATWNPPNRVEERRLRTLQQSVEDIGLIYPVILDESNRLIDGHRRVAVGKKLGWQHIPAITISSEFEHAYGSIQLNQMKLSGNDLLCVYLSNPNALLGSQKTKISRIEEVCGRPVVELLFKAGLTEGTFNLAMRVVRYIEAKHDATKCLRWLVKHNMGATIRHLLDGGIPATSLVKAITSDRPIKVGLKEIES